MIWFVGVLVVVALGVLIRWATDERSKLAEAATPVDGDPALEGRPAVVRDAEVVSVRDVGPRAPRPEPPAARMPSAEELARMGIDVGYPALSPAPNYTSDDLIAAWRFHAYLRRSTPLAVLKKFGTVVRGSERPPQTPEEFRNDAGWHPVTRLELDLGERGMLDGLPTSTMASEFGAIPEDGGEWIPRLIAFRECVEGPGSPDEKVARWSARVAADASLAPLATAVVDLLKDEINAITGISDSMVESLWARGCRTPADVFNLTDEQLRSVPGIGPKRLEQIRVAQGAAMGAM